MLFRIRKLGVACFVSASLAWLPHARARETRPVPAPIANPPAEFEWDESYHRAGWGNYVLVGVTGGIALAGLLIPPDRDDPWRATLGVDESARRAVRLTDSDNRRAARATSDVLAGFAVALPTLGDALLNVGVARDSPFVAWQLAVINAEVLGVTAALVGTAKWALSRERPFGRLCGTELDAASTGCTEDDRYVSFFSGHASFTFAAASSMCVHHHRFQLWGEVSPWVPCATSYALAATTGALRMAADRHYVSDVVTGAVIGTAVGLVVPWLHYSFALPASERRAMLTATGTGVAFTIVH